MTTAKARQPKGIRSGGQFAEPRHNEAPVQLTDEEKWKQEYERPLTVQDVEYLQKHHGTVDPGPRYFTHMRKVFDAAAEKAANTDEGRLHLRRIAQSEELAHITGGPAREIRDFYDEVKDLEPMSKGWENLVRTWADIWNRPRGEVTFIESKMRAVHGKPDLEELISQRDALTAQIDAQRLNAAAVAIRRKHPTAAWLEVREGTYPGDTEATLWDEKDKELWQGDSREFQELSSFDLLPMNYDAEKSPLRTSVEPGDELYRRTYSLDKMAAVTADALLQS